MSKRKKEWEGENKMQAQQYLGKNLSPHVPFNFTAPRSFWWRAWCSLWLWQDGGKDGRSRNPSISIDRGRAAGLWSCFFTLETFRANAFDFIIPVAPGRTQWSEAKTRHRVIYMALEERWFGACRVWVYWWRWTQDGEVMRTMAVMIMIRVMVMMTSIAFNLNLVTEDDSVYWFRRTPFNIRCAFERGNANLARERYHTIKGRWWRLRQYAYEVCVFLWTDTSVSIDEINRRREIELKRKHFPD